MLDHQPVTSLAQRNSKRQSGVANVMAYITVTTLADLIDPIDGKVSLREAVAQANAGDIIRFALNLEGGSAAGADPG